MLEGPISTVRNLIDDVEIAKLFAMEHRGLML